ncbi:MAG TPA: hypothetical protein VKZ65_02260 [Glycomyces sp.]|nr:hypothetical protein [Glycomyces sp.]
MVSDFPAGLSRSDIDFILQHDDEVLSSERIEGAKALWKISYSLEGRQPVELLIDNGVNEIYVQVFVQIDADHIVDALNVVQSYAVVGLTVINEMLFMRSGFFIEHSTMHALTNSYRSVAMAYLKYQQDLAA